MESIGWSACLWAGLWQRGVLAILRPGFRWGRVIPLKDGLAAKCDVTAPDGKAWDEFVTKVAILGTVRELNGDDHARASAVTWLQRFFCYRFHIRPC